MMVLQIEMKKSNVVLNFGSYLYTIITHNSYRLKTFTELMRSKFLTPWEERGTTTPAAFKRRLPLPTNFWPSALWPQTAMDYRHQSPPTVAQLVGKKCFSCGHNRRWPL